MHTPGGIANVGILPAGMMRSGSLAAVLFMAAALPAYAESDITLSGTAALLTQYVDRGITNSAEKPAVQPEFDLTYKEIFYAGIWASNVDFGTGPNGQDIASLEVDYYLGLCPNWGNGNSIPQPITLPIQGPSIQTAILIISSSGPEFRATSSTTS